MASSLRERKSNTLRSLGNALRQPDLPPAFAVVHSEHDGCFAWRMLGGRLDEEKIRAHLCYPDDRPVDDEPHLYFGGMRAVTLLRCHERNPDS